MIPTERIAMEPTISLLLSVDLHLRSTSPVAGKGLLRVLPVKPRIALFSLATIARRSGELRSCLVEGALETFLRNICLPQDNKSRETGSKAVDGILVLKKNEWVGEGIFDHIKHLFTYYEASAQQAFTRLRQEFEAKLGKATNQGRVGWSLPRTQEAR